MEIKIENEGLGQQRQQNNKERAGEARSLKRWLCKGDYSQPKFCLSSRLSDIWSEGIG